MQSKPETKAIDAAGVMSVLRPWLMEAHVADIGTVLIEELGIGCGYVRIDLAVVTPDRWDGYEIKSEADSLARLARQVEAYSAVLDRANLVTHTKHLKHATTRLPEWWGIIAVKPDGALEPIRQAGSNPGVTPRILIESLWRTEAARVLEAWGASKSLLRKPKHHLFDALIEIVPVEELRRAVRTQLRTRPFWGREEGGPRRTSIGPPPWAQEAPRNDRQASPPPAPWIV